MSQANGSIFHIEGFDPSMIYEEGIGIESANLLVGVDTDSVIGRVAACSFCVSVFMNPAGEPIFKESQ